MSEIWKAVPGFEGRYEVSDQGRVRSVSFMQRYLLRNGQPAHRRTVGRIASQQANNRGYMMVHLHLDNKRTARTVHSLVAEVFLAGPALPTVNHIDGNKANNCATNLEWATYSENHNHAVATGLRKKAFPVIAPDGTRYPSISSAERKHGWAARSFPRA